MDRKDGRRFKKLETPPSLEALLIGWSHVTDRQLSASRQVRAGAVEVFDQIESQSSELNGSTRSSYEVPGDSPSRTIPKSSASSAAISTSRTSQDALLRHHRQRVTGTCSSQKLREALTIGLL
jgi:hypothetical protein